MQIRKLALLLSTLCAAGAALADITVDSIPSQTGPVSSIGIPYARGVAAGMAFTSYVAGKNIKMIPPDDAFAPSTAAKNARKLIEEDPSKPRYLQTVWGFGYVFVPDGNKHSQ